MTAVKAKPAVCVHRYVLQEPNGPTVAGRCVNCGAERTWPAHIVQPEFARTNRKRGGTPGDAAWHTTPGSGFNGGKKAIKGELL